MIMRRLLFIFLSLFLLPLKSTYVNERENVPLTPYDAIINLGGNCQIAYQLHINGLRHYALPFDTWLTTCTTICSLLRHEFVGFLERENFVFVDAAEKRDKYVLDRRYGVRMIHDFRLDDKYLEDYENFAETYERRIKRFYDVIQKSTKVLFIRNCMSREEALILNKTLQECFKNLVYVLVVLGDTDEFLYDWQENHIRNFYLKQPVPYIWKGDNQAWQEILCACGFQLSVTTV